MKGLDLTGRKFGGWKVLGLSKTRGAYGDKLWDCICECGTRKKKKAHDLLNNKVNYCKACSYKKRHLDISGKQFGEWTAVEEAVGYKRGVIYWRCRCSCGKEEIKSLNHLKRHQTSFCRFCRELGKYRYLYGKTFGKLCVLGKAEHSSTHIMLECRCSCGNLRKVRPYSLVNGYINSCITCSRTQQEDLSGKKFNKWTVLCFVGTGPRRSRSKWLCQCECGNKREIIHSELINNRTFQCKECADKAKSYDLTGKIFGKYTVLTKEKNEKGILKWVCRCSCGTIRKITAHQLVSGKITNCNKCSGQKLQSSEAQAWQEAFKTYIKKLKIDKDRNKHLVREFNLTFEEFKTLSASNCFYCGREPNVPLRTGGGRFFKTGIDRIDSSKGYTNENCVPCCWACNRMKGRLTMEEFLNQINKIYLYKLKEN